MHNTMMAVVFGSVVVVALVLGGLLALGGRIAEWASRKEPHE